MDELESNGNLQGKEGRDSMGFMHEAGIEAIGHKVP